MLIQVTTDNHIHGSEGLLKRVEDEVSATLARFADHITRVEVHLHDENAHKAGVDKRCLIEARIPGRHSVSVSHDAETLDEAITGATEKLERALEHRDGRLHQHTGLTPMGGDPTF